MWRREDVTVFAISPTLWQIISGHTASPNGNWRREMNIHGGQHTVCERSPTTVAAALVIRALPLPYLRCETDSHGILGVQKIGR